MSADSVAQDQIRAFVDRILRLKEEVKAIQGDIREVYAEAKGNGFDKTVLGKLVNYVEKRTSDADALAEQDALFDLYLEAYDSASHTRAYARGMKFDADGVVDRREAPILAAAAGASPAMPSTATARAANANKGDDHETQGVAKALNDGEAAKPVELSAAVIDSDNMAAGAGSSAGGGSGVSASDVEPVAPHSGPMYVEPTWPPMPGAYIEPDAAMRPQTGPVARRDSSSNAGVGAVASPATNSRIAAGVSQPLAQGDVEPSSAGTEGGEDRQSLPDPVATLVPRVVVTVEAGRESATDPGALSAARLDRSKPHPDCRDPEDCGLASWTHMCGSCLRARAAKAAGMALQ